MEPDSSPVGRLVVCPTPIGNLGDITARGLQALREADVVACEDTRRTGVLLGRLGVERGGRRLTSLHDHNETERVGGLVGQMEGGATVVLISDAGMPAVSDPGYLLVRGAIAAAVPVEVLPGPSAVVTALVASGLPPTPFYFQGFLPRGRDALVRLLQGAKETIVAFESPKRMQATLQVIAEVDGAREVAVCRELTKLHEEVVRGAAAEVAESFRTRTVMGEVVLVVGAASAEAREAYGMAAAQQAVRELIDSGARPRAAARVVGLLAGVGANDLYDRALGRRGEPHA